LPAPVGHDLDPAGQRLAVNAEEAERVRAIFALFLAHQSLPLVVRELEARGWTNKRWRTRSGKESGGDPFTKVGLRRLLTNVLYVGKVRYKEEVHDGEQPALVDPGVFRRAQELLHGGPTAGAPARNRFGALLRGLLRCVPCGCAMTPSHSAKGSRRYCYYTCTNAQKRGWGACPSKSVPAGEIDNLVVERIRAVGRDPDLCRQIHAQARGQEEEAATALTRFDPVWETLTPADRARVVGLLVERVDYDGSQGKLSISFHPTGIKALADELCGRAQERGA
jgi:site-specific DNA recombinase